MERISSSAQSIHEASRQPFAVLGSCKISKDTDSDDRRNVVGQFVERIVVEREQTLVRHHSQVLRST